MRFFLAGILQLIMVSAVLAQANGDVESIGFDHAYRPGCWTPMVVRLTPTTGAPFKGKIAVYQEDGDHDHPIFTRPISLTGNTETGERTQRFWMYFIPQADLLRDGNDPTYVNRKLQVYLTTEDGKQLTRLLVKDPIDEMDDPNRARSTKLVLCVTEQSRPMFSPFAPLRSVIGLKEFVQPVMIPIASVRNLLPENVIGYEGVDAIVWCDADPAQLSAEQRLALDQYVHQGGKLIVLQTGKPNVWEMVKRGFEALLPVEVQRIEQSKDVFAIKRIVENRAKYAPSDRLKYLTWKDIGKGPYDIALGKPKRNTIVGETEGDDGAGRPWLVRGAVGSGSVTWIAQDLGDSNLTGRSGIAGAGAGNENFKWLYIWDRVFDWGNASQPAVSNPPPLFEDPTRKIYQERYVDAGGITYHLTRSFLAGMEFTSKSTTYLLVATIFFILYWVIAGPGSYLYLAARKRASQSWFAFALSALVATGVTIVIVKLALRGAPQVQHVSFVRMTPGEPAVVRTQFGLYIPRDGGQRVELMNTAKDAVSYITAYPTLSISDEGAPPLDYEVPVFNTTAVNFPYRSTLKKIQANWIGDLPLGIEGIGRISRKRELDLEGKLTNKSGRKLINVYLVFRPYFLITPGISNTSSQDQVMYIPTWEADATIDLANIYTTKGSVAFSPGQGSYSRGQIGDPGSLVTQSVERYWYGQFQHDPGFEDKGQPMNFLLLSLFDHLPTPSLEKPDRDRWDLHRPALRKLDVSGALGSGNLIVLAQSETPSPLPIPIEVEGEPVTGNGTIYYQFILPLDRSALNAKPTTTTQPANINADQVTDSNKVEGQ